MTTPTDAKKYLRSLPTRILAVVGLGSLLCICVCASVAGYIVLRGPQMAARDPSIGVDIGTGDHIAQDLRVIPASADRIYLEFYFEEPENSITLLEFRWYADNELISASQAMHKKGLVLAWIERDPATMQEFPSGQYRVEVWFVNTMLLSTTFTVEDDSPGTTSH